MTERRRGVLFTLIPGPGRSGRSWEVPRWALISGVLAIGQIGVFAGLLGYYLQTQVDIQGHSAQFVEISESVNEHWGNFQSALSTRKMKTMNEMRRRAALSRALRLGLGSRRTATTLLGGHVEEEWEREVERRSKSAGTLLWPVRDGWFVRGYGSGEGGYHLAVDIMGERGTDVMAAADGIVGYAGDKVRGYGNLLMIIHPGGFITAYAHNQKFYVVPGQTVKAGQTVAALGNTGISRGPHVHFEFMHGGKNCDPLALFRPGVRHRAGHLGEILQTVWMPTDKAPVQVACAHRRRHPHSRWVHEDEGVADTQPADSSHAAYVSQQATGMAQLQQTQP